MGYVVLDLMKVPKITLHVYKGQDLVIDFIWWTDELKTQAVELSEAYAQIRDEDDELILDLAPTISEDGTRAMVRLPHGLLADLPETGKMIWDVEVVAAVTTQRKTLARGPVRIYRQVSH